MAMCAMAADKPRIDERYRTSVRSSDLSSDPKTFRSDSDVLGAMGIVDKRLTEGWVPTGPDGQGYSVPKCELSVALERLFAGDNHAAVVLVDKLARMLWSKAERDRIKPKIDRQMARKMAQAVLAWHRGGTCVSCGGHGYDLIPGAPMLSERPCEPCGGTGKIPFEKQFIEQHREAARWLLGEITRAAGRAGPEAMKALAPKLEL